MKKLKQQLEKAQELYLREVEQNIEKLKEEIFRDDIEILRSVGYDKRGISQDRHCN